MSYRTAVLAIVFAFAASLSFSGCERTAKLTEQDHIQRAKEFAGKGNLKASILELKSAVQKSPNSPQARVLLGQMYLQVGMGADAEKELIQAEKLGISRESIKADLGDALLLKGEYKRVLDEIQPGDQTHKPTLARILQVRADAMFRQGKVEDSCSLYRQSLDTEKTNVPTYWGLSRCAVIDKDVGKAKELLTTALGIDAKHSKTWTIVGDLEQLNGKGEEALAAYTNALKYAPENLEALNNRAILNVKLGRMELAKADVEEISRIAPKSPLAGYSRALLRTREKRYREALESLQPVLKAAPDYLPALLLSGLIEFEVGNLATAESALNKVIRADPNNAIALTVLARAQLRLGRPDDALKTLSAFDMAKVKEPSLLSLAAEVALAKKEYSKAAAYFERAVETNPSDPASRTNLGIFRLLQGDERAMADLEVAAQMDESPGRASMLVIHNQFKQRQYDAALASTTSWATKTPESPLPWNYRGLAYLGKNELTKARSSFGQALKLDPKFLPAAINLSRLDLQDNKPDSARQWFTGILERDPRNIGAMMALADLAALQEQDEQRVTWLQKAAKSDPKAIAPREGLIRYYLKIRDYRNALDTAKEVFSFNPDSTTALNLLGETEMAAGQVDNALATYKKLAARAPSSPDAYLRLALVQIFAKRNTDARLSIGKALEIKEDHIPSLEALLRLELAAKNPEAALQVAEKMQKVLPQSPAGYERRADVLASLGRRQEAASAYRQALERGASATSLIKLLGVMSGMGDPKGAERYLAEWISRHPNDREARSYAARLYMVSNRNKEAIEQYAALSRLEPRDVSVINNLAVLYQREKDPRALTTAEQALKLAPDNAAVLDTVGWILVEQGQLERGTDLLRRAKAQAPKMGTIHFHYAAALARLGDKAEARKQLKTLIGSGLRFPELEEAKALLKAL